MHRTLDAELPGDLRHSKSNSSTQAFEQEGLTGNLLCYILIYLSVVFSNPLPEPLNLTKEAQSDKSAII